MSDLLTRLSQAGSVGLDLSPGDPLCAEAAFEIGRLRVEVEDCRACDCVPTTFLRDRDHRIAQLTAELDKINGDYSELLYKSTKIDADRIAQLEATLTVGIEALRHAPLTKKCADALALLRAALPQAETPAKHIHKYITTFGSTPLGAVSFCECGKQDPCELETGDGK